MQPKGKKRILLNFIIHFYSKKKKKKKKKKTINLQLEKMTNFFRLIWVCTMLQYDQTNERVSEITNETLRSFKGSRTGHSDKVSLWYASLLTNTRFRFFILE